MKKLRLILGDQLNSQHSWFEQVEENTIYLMAEMRQETDYVKHHIQKVTAFFLSMRNFDSNLKSKGHNVIYFKISDENNLHDLEKIITKCIEEHKISHFEYQLPDEFRLDEQLKKICSKLKIETKVYDTEHFYTSRTELT
jgi:deoxyribodipyrimidine photolyase-related protein